MSNFFFGNTSTDYLNQNLRFTIPVQQNDNKFTKLVAEYHKRQSIFLNNLHKEVTQNEQILKNDISNVFSKYDTNKNVIFAKYNRHLNNLYKRMETITRETAFI